MADQVLYQDSIVTLTNTYLTINKYYFPLATSKTIIFSDIQSVEINNIDGVNHRWGICSKYLNNWFSLDTKRSQKKKFIAVKMKNRNIKPSFTPDDAEKVFQIIWQNQTKQGRQQVEKRSSQIGKETEIAQQQIMERMKEEQQQNNKVDNTQHQLNLKK